jgi:hypothetical protein
VADDAPRLEFTRVDRRLLSFAAEHRLVLGRQVQRLLGEDVSERLSGLVSARLLRSGALFGESHYQIRPAGLAAIESDLPAPKTAPESSYRHDVGLAWLWLAAHGGSFGSLARVLSERRMRSHDGVLERVNEPYGVRTGAYDRFGHVRLHYPDLLLIDPRGRRLALELELSGKGRDRRELILGGYGSDPRIDRVLYLVEANERGRPIGRLIEASARQMGLSNRVGVQLIKPLQVIPDQSQEGRERPAQTQRRARPRMTERDGACL